jgi:hypothetical protein
MDHGVDFIALNVRGTCSIIDSNAFAPFQIDFAFEGRIAYLLVQVHITEYQFYEDNFIDYLRIQFNSVMKCLINYQQIN